MISPVKILGGGRINIGYRAAISIIDQDINLPHAFYHVFDKTGNRIGLALRETQAQMSRARQSRRKRLGLRRLSARHDQSRPRLEIYRVLAPGGRFSISDIVAETLPRSIRDHPAAYAACIAGAISEADYVGGLRAAGLDEITVDERLVYTAEQLRGLVASDLANLDLDPESLVAASTEIEGDVWSARIRGSKPLASR